MRPETQQTHVTSLTSPEIHFFGALWPLVFHASLQQVQIFAPTLENPALIPLFRPTHCQPFKKPQKLAHDGHLGSACNFCSKQTNLEFPAAQKKIDKAVVWATWIMDHWIHVAAFGCGEFGRKRRGRIQVLASGTCNKIIRLHS